MKRQEIIKELAIIEGIKTDYFDDNGCLQQLSIEEYELFLGALGYDITSKSSLEANLLKHKLEKWSRKVDPVLVTKKTDFPVLKFRIPNNELNDLFEWVLQEEGGRVNSGKFYASTLSVSGYEYFKNIGTFYEFDLPLAINPDIGYHKLIIKDKNNEQVFTSLIVTPEKCYMPETKEKKNKNWGIKLQLRNLHPENHFNIADIGDLTFIIKKAAEKKAEVLGLGEINQVVFSKESEGEPLISSKLQFNSLYLDIDNVIAFIGDKDLRLKVLSLEFLEQFEKLKEREDVDLKEIYELKYKVLKHLYNSFRVNHLNISSDLAKQFYLYKAKRGETFYKLSTFMALKEFFSAENASLESWHDWPQSYQNPYSDVVLAFERNNLELIEFYQFTQWQLELQMSRAGQISYENKLNIGLYTELPFYINKEGADAWLNQDKYCFLTKTSENKLKGYYLKEGYLPLKPLGIKNDAYLYFIETLRFNMRHSGALEISGLADFEFSQWVIKTEDGEKQLQVKYPLEDIIGIIALESIRNNCFIIAKELRSLSPRLRQVLLQYNIKSEKDFKLKQFDNYKMLRDFLDSNDDILTSIGNSVEDQNGKFSKPDSTYRLQLNKDFTFKQAEKIVDYLKNLGISHCYISPVLKARTASTHGYDIIDHNSFHPSIGSKQDFYDFADTLHRNGIGLICDIVPNHMGINSENIWWMDVLENGPSSEFAAYFDIDWNPQKLQMQGKVLVPILGNHYGSVISNGELSFKFCIDNGKFTVHYYDHYFPLNPSSYPIILEHRLNVLASRLGEMNEDFLEYESIITEFQNLPKHAQITPDDIKQRNRERKIAYKRLCKLCKKNNVIEDFLYENLADFKTNPDDSISCNRLHNLLEEQAYRLAYWRVSVDEINYRRFFDVNDLAAIRVENPAVFESTHNFIFEMIEQRKIDGLRLDHPDGLLDPAEYFKKLQIEAANRLGKSFNPLEDSQLASADLPLYVIAEKILANYETLPENWSIDGTVGYEFLNSVNGLFVKKENEKNFDRIYNRFISQISDYSKTVRKSKKLIMKASLAGELTVLTSCLSKIAEKDYSTRDFTTNNIRAALEEIIANFPVYRTYISDRGITPKCSDYIKWAVGAARKQSMSVELSLFDFIEKNLLLDIDKENELYQEALNFSLKFQQYTAPLMAKGMEDTAFYRYNRFIALNEVGGEPNHFGKSISEFHNENIERLKKTPYGLLTTSTHDTKRSEDVRMRLVVLSEIPDLWQKKIFRWSQLNRLKKTKIDDKLFPDRNDEYLFYQTLIGIWPDKDLDEIELNSIINRIEQYMIKAIRESKVNTSWINTNVHYEDAVSNFIKRVLMSPSKHPFWREFLQFQQEIAHCGYLNSISHTVLKLTSPGVPDIYQGNESLQFSLVDPDNRRPVNFDELKSTLDYLDKMFDQNKKLCKEDFETSLLSLNSGYMKMFFTSKLLKYRKNVEKIFIKGEYIPLEVIGNKQDHIIAFARKYKNNTIIVIAPRFFHQFVSINKQVVSAENWKNTKVKLSKELIGNNWENIFTNKTLNINNLSLDVSEVLQDLPCAVLSIKS